MPDLSVFYPLISIIVGAAVVVGVIWVATKLMWKVAEPNEALIISGLTRGTLETREGMDFKIVTGKGALVLPGLQTVRPLSLTLNETELKVSCVTSQGIQVIVDGVVIYKIGDAPPFIANAARRFLGQQPKMESQVYNVFEGHLRSIIGSMTVEEIIRERDKLASQVRSASGVEMEKLGLVVDSLQIKDLQDPTGYIQNIAKPHIAQVKMEARIAEATRNREAAEKEAEAEAMIADARSLSAIRQSEAQANAERAKANAAQAGPLADATARQQVVVQETEVAKLEADREEQKLQTTVRKPADARAYAKRTDAEGQKVRGHQRGRGAGPAHGTRGPGQRAPDRTAGPGERERGSGGGRGHQGHRRGRGRRHEGARRCQPPPPSRPRHWPRRRASRPVPRRSQPTRTPSSPSSSPRTCRPSWRRRPSRLRTSAR